MVVVAVDSNVVVCWYSCCVCAVVCCVAFYIRVDLSTTHISIFLTDSSHYSDAKSSKPLLFRPAAPAHGAPRVGSFGVARMIRSTTILICTFVDRISRAAEGGGITTTKNYSESNLLFSPLLLYNAL